MLGGIIGAALGALFSKGSKHTMTGALAGAALAASLSAFEESKNTGEPVLFIKDGKMYKALPDGSEEYVKDVPQSQSTLPNKLNLGK